MNRTAYSIFLFFTLALLQVFVFNNIHLFGFVNPYLYIAFVFVYPLNKNRFPFLLLSFLLGLTIDLFMDCGGVNAFATLFIAFIRLNLFKRIFQKPENEYDLFRFKKEPFGDVFNYVTILTIVHHFILFSLINFSFSNFLSNVLLNTTLSSILTLTLYFLCSFIFRKNNNET